MKRTILLFALLAAGTAALAGPSASHTVTIRIIRPNEFSVKPVESQEYLNVKQSQKSAFTLNWKTSTADKRITVSAIDSENGGKLVLDEGVELTLDQQHKDLTTGLASREGNCEFRYVNDTASLTHLTRLVYTMTDF